MNARKVEVVEAVLLVWFVTDEEWLRVGDRLGWLDEEWFSDEDELE